VPIVSVVIGEAAGAAGVALGMGDRILMQEHAVYTVGGAEGTDRRPAEPLVASRTLTAAECRRLGVADGIIPEPSPAAHVDPEAASRMLGAAIVTALADLAGVSGSRSTGCPGISIYRSCRPRCGAGCTSTPRGCQLSSGRAGSWLTARCVSPPGGVTASCPGENRIWRRSFPGRSETRARHDLSRYR
jgi:hypothetical protein